MHRVAVVILNYNGLNYLKKFLPGVVQYSSGSLIVVADNRSTDDSVAYVQAHFPTVRVIELSRNEGFSRGYNLALQQIDTEYYVLLNSDVEVTSGWLPPMLALMDADPQIAACQPKIKSYRNKHLFEYAGAAGGFIDRWGYPFCRGRVFEHIEPDNGQYDDVREVFWASGACMMVRAKAYHAMNGLDDYFFAHMEEIDLCWRLKNAGYLIYFCGKSEVYHVGGGTLAQAHPRKTYLNFRNSLIMLYKNLPPNLLWSTIFVRLVLDGIAALRFLVTGSGRNILAILHAHVSFYRNYHRWKNDRKQRAYTLKLLHYAQVFSKSIVYTCYIENKKKFTDFFH